MHNPCTRCADFREGLTRLTRAGRSRWDRGARDRRSGGLADPSDSAFKVIRASDGKGDQIHADQVRRIRTGRAPAQRRADHGARLPEPERAGLRHAPDERCRDRGSRRHACCWPTSSGRTRTAAFPALVSFSPYPRQIQDVGAPLGFIEAGASDFFVPRGYVHLIVNARGTGGSGGAWSFFDGQERRRPPRPRRMGARPSPGATATSGCSASATSPWRSSPPR